MRVRPCSGDVLERPARHPHVIDRLQRGDPGAPVRATVVRQRQRPKELVPRPRMFCHVVVEDGVHCAFEPLRLPVRLPVGRRRYLRFDREQVAHLAPEMADELGSPVKQQPVRRTIGGHPVVQEHRGAVHHRGTVNWDGTHQLGEPVGYHQDEPVAGSRPVERPIEVHRRVLEGNGGGKQGQRRAPLQGTNPLSCTDVALPNLGDDICRHTHPVVIPPH